ncbi:MAG: glutamate decarboxylase [Propionibacteriaceae bacterium]|nr:glutamate decarboxylase [Propionibacteriaceae bacterium]
MALHSAETRDLQRLAIAPMYARPGEVNEIPRSDIPSEGLDPRVAYQLIHDELMLDGNARQNLATFVTTFMDEEADRLFVESADKNMIDKDEYPQTAAIEGRCVSILSNLWNSPAHEHPTGTSTTGSSEAVMLAGLALKWRWRQRRTAAGLSTDRPNLVMGINVQVVWEKFCRYWDVDARYAPIEEGRLQLNAEEALKLCDENTIGVVAILGSTFDGSYEPVKAIADALDALAASGGPDIPVHVDAASGGFIAPFIDPDLEWDFRVPRVRSINASGHKYGLVYPGVGQLDARRVGCRLRLCPDATGRHREQLGADADRASQESLPALHPTLPASHPGEDGRRHPPGGPLDEADVFGQRAELTVRAGHEAGAQGGQPAGVEPGRLGDCIGLGALGGVRVDDVAGYAEVGVDGLPRDQQVHDLGRALEDAVDAKVAQDLLHLGRALTPGLQRVGGLVAASAADLGQLVGYLPRHLGGVQLDQRGLDTDVVGLVVGEHAAQVEHRLQSRRCCRR